MSVTKEHAAEIVAELQAMQEGRGIMHRVPAEKLASVLAKKPHVLSMFDLTDPDCPVIVKVCKGCEAPIRFPCRGGVPLLGIQFLYLARCDDCDAKDERAAELKKLAESKDRRLAESGIPAALLEQARWENIIETGRNEDETNHRRIAIEAAKRWAKEKDPHPRGLFLYHRGVGTGKTLLAATAAAERCGHSSILWVQVGVLVNRLQGAWADDERQKALKALTSAGAVVFDDLDKIPPKDFRVRSTIFAAIDARDQAGAPLIVTSNLGPKQLDEAIGEAAASRFAAPCHRLPYPGPDRRLELGASA